MDDQELAELIRQAPQGFPVLRLPGTAHEPIPAHLQHRAARRRTVRMAGTVLAGAAAVVAVAVAVPLGLSPHAGSRVPVVPASSTAANYLGTRWRLVAVSAPTPTQSRSPENLVPLPLTSPARTPGASAAPSVLLPIPAGIGAWVEFGPDDRIVARDGVNALSGRFRVVPGGFEVRNVGTTLALYAGKDPTRLATIAAIGTLMSGSRPGELPAATARDTVLELTQDRLVIQAGAIRLTLSRQGPASDRWLQETRTGGPADPTPSPR